MCVCGGEGKDTQAGRMTGVIRMLAHGKRG